MVITHTLPAHYGEISHRQATGFAEGSRLLGVLRFSEASVSLRGDVGNHRYTRLVKATIWRLLQRRL